MPLEHIGLRYCKTNSFNYMNFRLSIQVPALNSNHTVGHLIPRPVHRDHVMPMVVIVLSSSPVSSSFLMNEFRHTAPVEQKQ